MKVLVVRPAPSCNELVNWLNQIQISAVAAPLLSFSIGAKSAELGKRLKAFSSGDLVIAVSQRAIHYAHQALEKANISWPTDLTYIAIGETSAKTWLQLSNIKALIPKTQDSEGLLQLPCIATPKAKNILILRGNGGRNLLGNHLKKSGIEPCYVETYQRHWDTKQAKIQALSWQKKQLDTLVVTSGEQLTSLFYSLDQKGQQWLHSCQLLVPSQRILSQAKTLGFTQVACTHSASNDSFFHALKAMNNSG